MREALQNIKETAAELLEKAANQQAVEELRIRFLGKKGEVTSINSLRFKG